MKIKTSETDKFMTEEEFEVFSPLYYIMSYEEYCKNMEKKEGTK